jgi:response regulator of citrate/malate metabolism
VFYYLHDEGKINMDKINHDDVFLALLDDTSSDITSSAQPWRVLVVDDDGEVHQATRFALSGVEIMDRPLSLIHAYSGAEAEVLLRQMPDIAVVLLDVVMESDDSGLCLIDVIRDGLAYKPLRIILRTGQPGLAPEAALVARYDIHDYMLKTDVSRERLLTSLTTAVRTFNQLKQMAQMKQQMSGMMQAVNGVLVAKTPIALAQVVMQQLTSLYGLSSMVVVWKDNADTDATVVATDQQHQAWQNKVVSELSGDPLINYITQLLSADASTQFSDSIVLLGNGWRLIVVLQENDPIQKVVPESWEMFQSLVVACANHALV